MSADAAARTLALWCADWPVRAVCDDPQNEPVAVIEHEAVVACSTAARQAGVQRGIRKREAYARCPSIRIAERDHGAEARSFEPVVSAVENLSPLVEVLRPGLCVTPTRGPSRYFGGDEAFVERLAADIAGTGVANWSMGIAAGRFAAVIAARDGGMTVEPGNTRAFLSEKPITRIDDPALAGLLKRLGIKTLGAFAALPADKVLDRFGPAGAALHRLAGGLDDAMPVTHEAEVDHRVEERYDDPIDTSDRIGFQARGLATVLVDHLSGRALACRLLAVEMHTEHGEIGRRLWRHEVAFDVTSIADRVRWQLDAWLSRAGGDGPTAGVVLLRLEPCEIVPATGRQYELWGGESDADRRVGRAIARVQAMLGFDAVTVPALSGGRDHSDRVRMVPWDERVECSGRPNAVEAPWPGGMPAPSPSLVHRFPKRSAVLDVDGKPVIVDVRGMWRGEPSKVAVAGGPAQTVFAYSSPWLSDERWWSQDGRRRVSVQFVLEKGAHLFVFEKGQWWLAATYD